MKNKGKTIVYYPVFESDYDLNDHLARAAWYFGYLSDIKQIVFAVKPDLETGFQPPAYLDDVSEIYYRSIEDRIVFLKDKEEYKKKLLSSDIIMRWSVGTKNTSVSESDFGECRHGKQIWNVDNKKERYEGSHYIKAGLTNHTNNKRDIRRRRQKFRDLARKIGRGNKSYIFGTGPTVSLCGNFDYSDGVSIICNTTIMDYDLVRCVNPKILIIGDPIFHFGISEYAGEFRKKLFEILAARPGLFVIIPYNYYPLLVSHFSELESRIIGIPFKANKEANLDLLKAFYITTTSNILTNLMIPVAATISNDINIIGCDGRPKNQDRYFWDHCKKTQINDKMSNIREAHPSFFKIDYNMYYQKHAEILCKWIETCEKRKIDVNSLTPSYIPALRARYQYKNKDYENDFYPLVSVIIPTYHNSKTVSRAIESVKDQDYVNWELIIINAGKRIKEKVKKHQR
jgi:hypothetical protein